MIKESVIVDDIVIFQCFHQGESDETEKHTRSPVEIDGELVFWVDSASRSVIAKNKNSLMITKLESV